MSKGGKVVEDGERGRTGDCQNGIEVTRVALAEDEGDCAHGSGARCPSYVEWFIDWEGFGERTDGEWVLGRDEGREREDECWI